MRIEFGRVGKTAGLPDQKLRRTPENSKIRLPRQCLRRIEPLIQQAGAQKRPELVRGR